MKAAYIDTSCVVAIAFAEPGSRKLAKHLKGFDGLYSSNLLEAEWRSTVLREELIEPATNFLSAVSWILPNRPLTGEFERVLACGYVKGADLWHLASALFLNPDPSQLFFLTLDQRQNEIAAALGFQRL